jgi:hypothetical protein
MRFARSCDSDKGARRRPQISGDRLTNIREKVAALGQMERVLFELLGPESLSTRTLAVSTKKTDRMFIITTTSNCSAFAEGKNIAVPR